MQNRLIVMDRTTILNIKWLYSIPCEDHQGKDRQKKPKFTWDSLGNDRKPVKVIVGLLSGHCGLKTHRPNGRSAGSAKRRNSSSCALSLWGPGEGKVSSIEHREPHNAQVH